MTRLMTRGERLPLEMRAPVEIFIDFEMEGLDIAAFPLGADRRMADDRYALLFSNLRSPDGEMTLELTDDSARMVFDLRRIPAGIHRVLLTATHDARAVAGARHLVVTVAGALAYNVARDLTSERAVMMAEIYRHGDGWRVGAIGAGFEGGLAALINHLGGQVA